VSVPSAAAVAAVALLLVAAGMAAVAVRAAREAARVRRGLAEGIAHDLRTPLAEIHLFTEMLLMGRERSDDERRRWLEAVERGANRLSEVTDNLLLFVHGAEPDPYPYRRPVDLGALVEDVAVAFAARASAARMRIEVDPPAGIAALADPAALRQVVVNLLDNALRFGPAGQTVGLTLAVERGRAVLRVRDEGPGVPAESRAAVWRPFVRLSPASSADAGSGLGLTVVRRVVEAHGGRCRVEDAPGGGAQVTVALPALRGGHPHGVPHAEDAEDAEERPGGIPVPARLSVRWRMGRLHHVGAGVDG
jgi:signal transduction histidine kinase